MQQQQQCSGWIVLFLRWYRRFFSHECSLVSLPVPRLTCGALDEESKSQRRPAAMLRVLSLRSRCSLGTSGVSMFFWKDYVSGHTGIDPMRRAGSKRPYLGVLQQERQGRGGTCQAKGKLLGEREREGMAQRAGDAKFGSRRRKRAKVGHRKKFDSSFSGSVTHCHDVQLCT